METINILITGANGQLGHEMRNVLAGDQRFNAFYTDVAGDNVVMLDITDEAVVEKFVALTVKHVVGGDVYHAGTVTLGNAGKDAHGISVEAGG